MQGKGGGVQHKGISLAFHWPVHGAVSMNAVQGFAVHPFPNNFVKFYENSDHALLVSALLVSLAFWDVI